LTFTTQAQPFLRTTPFGLDSNFNGKLTALRSIESRFLPSINADSLIQEDKKLSDKDIEDARNGRRIKPRAMRFAQAITVSFNLQNVGTWDELSDGSRVWRLKLISPGAQSMSFTFDRFYIPEGGKFFVYNEIEREQEILGAFTSIHNAGGGKFATAPINGSVIVLEYSEPSISRRKGKISISNIALGYINIIEYGKRNENNSIKNGAIVTKDISDDIKTQGYVGAGGTDDKPCMTNTDIRCPQFTGYSDVGRSVVYTYVNQGTELCSGALVNRAGNSLYNVTPMVLTAYHCFDNNQDGQLSSGEIATAETVVYRFKYERISCGSNTLDNSDYYSGSTFLAGYHLADIALLRLNVYPAAMLSTNIYLSGWTRSPIYNNTALPLTGIHHPLGDVKKVMQQTQGYATVSYNGNPIISYTRTVTNIGKAFKGSSGSPLFNNQKLIIGVESQTDHLDNWINSGCTERSQLYGNFDIAWEGDGTYGTRLKDHLDPFNSGVVTQSGINLNTAWNGNTFAKAPINNDISNSIITTAKVYPSVSTDNASVAYSISENAVVLVEVFDALFRKVGVLVNTKSLSGFYEHSLQSLDLNSGSYKVKITVTGDDGRIDTKLLNVNFIR
jgi:hypothetical protein